ncbi:MAG: MBL fold metallo-hydrolase [Planctomycetes bacterium]|nr:MBL fold metallo-hydrolase [Planctomycetota bacterium]
MPVTITFLGAAEGVTGSRHLLDVDGTRILVDCGLFQGKRDWSRLKNAKFPIDPSSVHNVVLTHGHIDHSGALPVLCRDGFSGHIYCTAATADLAKILLRDSGNIQESDARYLNHRLAKEAKRRGQPPPKETFEPLYTIEDAERCDRYFHSVPYREDTKIGPGISMYLTDQGHIIGSAAATITIQRGDETLRVCFSGDRGRKDMPILRDPQPYPDCDLLLTESTYGNRRHEPLGEMESSLEAIVKKTMQKKGRLIIPAFSVGRTQNILYHLRRLQLANRLPRIEIFVDSPLSTKATKVYAEHPECYDRETRELLTGDDNPFHFPGLRYVESVEESMELNDHPGPCIILSASGMCEAGRILHHLKHSVSSPRNTILIVGYMAKHTLGRRLRERPEKVRIFGRYHPLEAEVVTLNGLSAHGDRDDIIQSAAHLKGKVRTILLIHGEREQSEPLREALLAEGHPDVRIAELDQTVELAK